MDFNRPSNQSLAYFSSGHIKEFVANNPIEWSSKELAGRGGWGDRAGATPTPAVYEFLRLLRDKGALFTQNEYAIHCREAWTDWLDAISGDDKQMIRNGVRAKLYRNFYPSMIDSLHVWAILCESGRVRQCVIDSTQDAVGKTDITAIGWDWTEYKIALMGPTKAARDDRVYKVANRGGSAVCHEVGMLLSRERSPGNKRWFELCDFDFIEGCGNLFSPEVSAN